MKYWEFGWMLGKMDVQLDGVLHSKKTGIGAFAACKSPGQRKIAAFWKGAAFLSLIEQVVLNKFLHQFVPIQLADHGSGVIVVGNIRGILG